MPTWLNSMTVLCAGVGAVLGVVNFLRSLGRDRMRLQVVPQCCRVTRDACGNILRAVRSPELPEEELAQGAVEFGVKIINLSAVTTLTIESIEFDMLTVTQRYQCAWRQWCGLPVMVKPRLGANFVLVSGNNLPYQLAPRTAVLAILPGFYARNEPCLRQITAVVAITACALQVRGNGPALKEHVRKLRLRADLDRRVDTQMP